MEIEPRPEFAFPRGGIRSLATWAFMSWTILIVYWGAVETPDMAMLTQCITLSRAIVSLVLLVVGLYMKHRFYTVPLVVQEVLTLLLASSITSQLTIESMLMIGAAVLFWSEAVVVRIAFSTYSASNVLIANFFIHYLPFCLLVILIFIKLDSCKFAIQKSVSRSGFINASVFPFGSVVLSICIYLQSFDFEFVYGLSLDVNTWILPVCTCVLGLTCFQLYYFTR